MRKKIALFAAQMGTVGSALSAMFLFAAFVEGSLSFVGFVLMMPFACMLFVFLFRFSVKDILRAPIRNTRKASSAAAKRYGFSGKKGTAA